MNTKFPFSMENIPRRKSFACFSLKFGCIVSGLITILGSTLVIASCWALVTAYADDISWRPTFIITVAVGTAHVVTLFLSALMLVGVLKDKLHLIKPWVVWTSLQVMANTFILISWTTMNMINHFNDAFLLDFAIQFMGLLIRFYMLMIVGSYYKQLVEEKGENERLVKLMSTDNWYSA